MSQYKIIFTGPVGAGKTTAINSISDSPPIKTDAAASDMTKSRKAATTVAMDYGIMNLVGGEKKFICTVRRARNALILCGRF